MREICDNDNYFSDIMKTFHLYTECVIGADELFRITEDLFNLVDEDSFKVFRQIALSREVSRRK